MANNLGRYKAEITADTRKFRKELGGAQKSSNSFHRSASAMSSAVAAIDGPFGGISSRISAFTSLTTKGGLAVGLFAGGISALGAVTLATTSHMAKLEVATAKTTALLKATGGASGYTAQQLDTMARSVALNTLASTEGIRNAQNALLTFKSISGPVFESTIRLSQDMAAVFGGDAKSAALQLGKALEDPITGLTALRRVGVTFTEQQKDQIKAMVEVGDKAEAQRLILSELQNQIGGSGAAEAGGLSGAVDTLGQRWEELLEAWNKTTGSADKASKGVGVLTTIIDRYRQLLDPTDDERYNEALVERWKITAEIAKIEEEGYRRYSGTATKVKELKAEQAELDKELARIKAKRASERVEETAARVKSEKVQAAAVAETKASAEGERLEKLKTALTKEVDAVAASLLSKEEKENAYHAKRIASLEKLAEVDPSRSGQIEGFKTAEYQRHIEAKALLDQEAAAKRREADILEFEESLIKHDSHLELYRSQQEEQTRIAGEAAEKRASLERQAQATVSAMHQSTWQEAANFLGVFAGKSKAAAIASIAITKGLAIAQTIAHTQTASMLAFASQLIPGDPTSPLRAAAAAASVESMGAIKVGLIAATGLAQAAQTLSGGAGSSNYGAPGTSTSTAYQPAQQTIPLASDSANLAPQIIIQGTFSGINESTIEALADQLAEKVSTSDIVLVHPSSRNGQMLAGL